MNASQTTTSSLLLLLVFLATVADVRSLNPDCKLGPVAGYQNCRSEHFVNVPSADALWCSTSDACEKVLGVDKAADLTGSTARVAPPVREEEPEEELQISAVEEQVSSARMLRAATTSALLVVAVSGMMILC